MNIKQKYLSTNVKNETKKMILVWKKNTRRDQKKKKN